MAAVRAIPGFGEIAADFFTPAAALWILLWKLVPNTYLKIGPNTLVPAATGAGRAGIVGKAVDLLDETNQERGDADRVLMQVNACVNALYGNPEELPGTAPINLVNSVYRMLQATHGSLMVSAEVAIAEFGFGGIIHDSCRLAVLAPYYAEPLSYNIKGVVTPTALRRCDVMVALADRTLPYLVETINTIEGPETIDTAATTNLLINIVGTNQRLHGEKFIP